MLNIRQKTFIIFPVLTAAFFGCFFFVGSANATAGTTTSAIYDAGSAVPSNSISWNATIPANTSILMEARAGNVASPDGTWTGWITVSSGIPTNSIGTKRYLQYRSTLTSTNNSDWPFLLDMTWSYVNPAGSLLSSYYNTNDVANVLASISWTETQEGGSDVKFQLRTSPDGATWTDFLGPTGTGDYYTDPTGNETINTEHATGGNDQWLQYKVFLTSDNAINNPTLSDVTVYYVVNSPPNIQNVTATQGSDGVVDISYDIKDIDAASGTVTQNYVTPTFQYSLNGGTSWTSIATTSITFGAAPPTGDVTDTNHDGDIDNKALQGSFLTYTAAWLASTTIPAIYSADFKIKAIIDDNELANAVASSTSSSGILDTTVPASVSLHVYGTSTPATLALSATDNSSMQMRTSLDSGFGTGSGWIDYNIASTIALATDPDTVYVQFKDAYGNVSAVNVTTPATPNNAMIQDISNLALDPPVYGLFAAWGVIAEPTHTFGSYQVYHLVGSDYLLAGTVNSRLQNYYADFELTADSAHSYKIIAVDASGNTSGYSSVISGTANGVQDGTEGGGGVETTPPVISGVTHSGITTQSATITWNTDELADSRVEYITSTGGDFSAAPYVGVASMLNTAAGTGIHSVTLSGLSPSTTYYYKVKSTDATEINTASSTLGVDGYTFTTEAGPSISNVLTASVRNTSATITWTTTSAASSYVYYSTNSNMSGANNTGSDAGTTSHSVTVSGLTSGVKYYFYVKSGLAEDKNVINGTITYYTFTTISDTTAPIITFNRNTNVTGLGDTTATISWTTNELATSTLEYGIDTSYGSTTLSNNNYNENHSFDLTGLSLGETYYFRLKSTDENSNTRTDSNGGAGYTFTTTDSTDDTAPNITVNPVASPVADISAAISWTTNEASDSTVDYGTTSGSYTLSSTSSNSDVSHVLILSSLTSDTTYYYRVTSEDANANPTSSTEYSFKTLQTLSQEAAVVAREAVARQEGADSISTLGGGTVYVTVPSGGGQASDTTAPVVSEIKTANITSESAVISWKTNENADSFVEYGNSSSYGLMSGKWGSETSHSITLKNLLPEQMYYYGVSGKDAAGNLGQGTGSNFTTLSLVQELQQQTGGLSYQDVEKLTQDLNAQKAETEIKKVETAKANSLFEMASQAISKAMDIIKQTVSKVSLGSLESGLIMQQNTIEDLARSIPAPLLSGEPKVLVTAKTATIIWKTDKVSNSLIATAKNDGYRIASDNPYLQVVGNPADKTTDHLVMIYDLEPDSLYHYQLRSQGLVGPEARSNDFTFKTAKEVLEISNYAIQNISTTEGAFKWVTNVEADSTVKYTPYRDNILAQDEVRTKYDKAFTTIHEVSVDNFEPGVIYKVELLSSDLSKNIADKAIDSFSTSEDDLPPIIYQVQTNSAISPGKEAKIQTIIFWMTNEPSTTKVYYQSGIAGADQAMSESTKPDNNYTKKHVAVITKFEPGKVYSFRVESIDSGSNTSLSKVYTILTPQQSASVFQVIMKNMEDVFGWMKMVN